MAKKTLKSNLLKKLGTAGRKAVEAHQNDEIMIGGGASLPPGIENGVAQLTECKFDTFKKGDNKGELFFYASGVIIDPKDVTVGKATVKVEGLTTSIMEAICDTPNRSRVSIDEHIDWVMNELRKLGVDTTELTSADLEDTVDALKDQQPYFIFRTWQGDATDQYPNPRVNHDWRGTIEDYEEGETEDDVVEEDSDESEESETTEDSDDLMDLGKAADDGDDTAASNLTDQAEENGLDANDYPTWVELAEALSSEDTKEESETDEEEEDDSEEDDSEEDDSEEDDSEEEEEEEMIEPEKGEVCEYKPPRTRKFIDCEITAVFKSKETCNLKSVDDGKVFKSVAWDKLVIE